jgi:hypothetical protein
VFCSVLEFGPKSYNHFYAANETLEMVREQFEEMVVEILGSSGLMGLSYHELLWRAGKRYGRECLCSLATSTNLCCAS